MEPPPLLRLSNQPGLAATTDRTQSPGLVGLHFRVSKTFGSGTAPDDRRSAAIPRSVEELTVPEARSTPDHPTGEYAPQEPARCHLLALSDLPEREWTGPEVGQRW